MARERKIVEVDGIRYSYRQLSPTTATFIFLKLIKIFGPVLGKAYGGDSASIAGVKNIAGDLSKKSIADIIDTVVDRIDPDEMMNVSRKLLSDTFPANKLNLNLGVESNFDQHFEDTPGMLHFFKLMKEVLQLQYADFFIGIGSLVSTKAEPQDIDLPQIP